MRGAEMELEKGKTKMGDAVVAKIAAAAHREPTPRAMERKELADITAKETPSKFITPAPLSGVKRNYSEGVMEGEVIRDPRTARADEANFERTYVAAEREARASENLAKLKGAIRQAEEFGSSAGKKLGIGGTLHQELKGHFQERVVEPIEHFANVRAAEDTAYKEAMVVKRKTDIDEAARKMKRRVEEGKVGFGYQLGLVAGGIKKTASGAISELAKAAEAQKATAGNREQELQRQANIAKYQNQAVQYRAKTQQTQTRGNRPGIRATQAETAQIRAQTHLLQAQARAAKAGVPMDESKEQYEQAPQGYNDIDYLPPASAFMGGGFQNTFEQPRVETRGRPRNPPSPAKLTEVRRPKGRPAKQQQRAMAAFNYSPPIHMNDLISSPRMPTQRMPSMGGQKMQNTRMPSMGKLVGMGQGNQGRINPAIFNTGQGNAGRINPAVFGLPHQSMFKQQRTTTKHHKRGKRK
jgi:hypothetical protein